MNNKLTLDMIDHVSAKLNGQIFSVKEWVKEINCLNGISEDISKAKITQDLRYMQELLNEYRTLVGLLTLQNNGVINERKNQTDLE